MYNVDLLEMSSYWLAQSVGTATELMAIPDDKYLPVRISPHQEPVTRAEVTSNLEH